MSKFSIEKIIFGRIPDTADSRDFNIRKLLYRDVPLPSKYIVNPNTIVYNQGSTPACVGYSAAGVKTDQEYLENTRQKLVEFDGLWLYNECKKVDGYPDEAGTQLRYALKIMMKWMKQKDSLPICKWINSEKVPDTKWRIQGYYRISNTEHPDFVKQVIYQYGSVYMGSVWYKNWFGVDSKGVLPEGGEPNGGHAYRLIGWDDTIGNNNDGFILVNSWGKDWGNDGIVIMPYWVFTQVMYAGCADCWKVVDAVN